MTEPTRERILAHARAWEAAAASINNEDSGAAVLAYALRIAANLPSEEDIDALIRSGLALDAPVDTIATAILERIRRGA